MAASTQLCTYVNVFTSSSFFGLDNIVWSPFIFKMDLAFIPFSLNVREHTDSKVGVMVGGGRKSQQLLLSNLHNTNLCQDFCFDHQRARMAEALKAEGKATRVQQYRVILEDGSPLQYIKTFEMFLFFSPKEEDQAGCPSFTVRRNASCSCSTGIP